MEWDRAQASQRQFLEGCSRRPLRRRAGNQRVQGQGQEGPALIIADQGDGDPRQARAGLTGALEEMDQDALPLVDGMVDPVADVVNFTVIPDESEVLARLREFPLLDELPWATRSKKIKTFSGQVALVVNRLRVFSCDVLFLALQGTPGSGILGRHRQTLQIFSLVFVCVTIPEC